MLRLNEDRAPANAPDEHASDNALLSRLESRFGSVKSRRPPSLRLTDGRRRFCCRTGHKARRPLKSIAKFAHDCP